MKKLRNLTISLLLVAGAGVSTCAAASTVSHAEHDADLRAEMSETVSGGLLAVLLANACVVATGVRVARNRSRRQREGERKTAPTIVDAHDRPLDIA